MQLSYISFCVLFFAIGHIAEILYATILKRQFNAYAFKNILDLVIFALFFTLIIVTYQSNLSGTWKEKGIVGEVGRAEAFLRNFALGHPSFEISLLIFCAVSMWIRVFFLMRFNEYLGRLAGILSKCL